jgi:hypothetical protein
VTAATTTVKTMNANSFFIEVIRLAKSKQPIQVLILAVSIVFPN